MYSVNLEKIDILRYKDILKSKYLIPSRKILLDNIDVNFNNLKNLGMDNLATLKKELDNENKRDIISKDTKITMEYLDILRREIGGIKSKVVKILDFNEVIDANLIDKLVDYGVVTSKDYYDIYLSKDTDIFNIEQLSKYTDKLKELYILCNYIRMDGIGVLAAKAFFKAGYNSIKEISEDNSDYMLNKISNINKDNKYFTNKLGKKDMQYCIDSAKLITNFENI